ncbi:hypothetical protein LRS73_00840 [Methylobacterium currus]|nr:hypothetical protein [Methylobacterium currus]UHC16525.1 hypothetical protein LRS73_00840 [Methylobacterium currus]
MNEREGPASTDGIAPPPDALIVQARQAACGPGEAETQVRQRELRARTLLRSAHKRLDEAAAREAQAEMRVRAAEERLRVVEARAAARVEAAEARARRAEEAARSALAWLQRLQPAEFGGGPAAAQPPGLRRVA